MTMHKYMCGILLSLFVAGFAYEPPDEPLVVFSPAVPNSGQQTNYGKINCRKSLWKITLCGKLGFTFLPFLC